MVIRLPMPVWAPEGVDQGAPNLSGPAANVAPEVDLPTSEGADDWSAMGNPSIEDVAANLSTVREASEQQPAQPGAQVQQPQQPAQTAQAQYQPQAQPQQVPPVQYAPQQPAQQLAAQQPQGAPAQAAVSAPAQTQDWGPQPAAQPASLPQSIPEVLQMLTQNAQLAEDAIAASEFQLSPQDQQALETDAGAHIPKLMARAQMRAMTATLHYVNQFIPQMIEQSFSRMIGQAQSEQQFFTQFPHLNRQDIRPEIMRVGQALRQAYPQAPQADLVRMIGQTLSMRYPAQQQPAGQPQQQPGQPQRVQQIPFIPSVAQQRGPIPQAPQPIASDDWFNGMRETYD